VLGHALYMTALHGGQATHDTIDAHQIAVLWRGGMLPQASVYPATMRATRDLRRRRRSRTRKRAERLAHIQNTTRQDHRPEIGTTLADNANRAGVAARCPDPAVQKSLAVDLARLGSDDPRLNALEWHSVKAATPHDATPLDRRQTVPGIGTILSLGLLAEIHDLQRFPSGQDVVAYGRLGTCAQESAGKRSGTAGAERGQASLTWACSDAAVLVLRDHPAGQTSLPRWAKQPGRGQALTLLAQQLGRAVYDLVTRQQAFAGDTCLQDS
jgi:transposase